jgi:uncharacterized protein (TIGR01777 family)
MRKKKIILAGGTGFIGQALAARWGKENQIVILSRQNAKSHSNSYGKNQLKAGAGYQLSYCHWDGRHVERNWADELEGSDLVVNLAGRSVNCRYTPRNKQEIFDSRTDATRVIGQAIHETMMPPKLWINAASATIYRYALDRPQDETTGEIGEGFSVQVCQRWENTFFEQPTPFTRKIALRTAITLGDEGVIVPYLNLLKFGLGGRQGSGRQMYSWVHIDDVAKAIEWLLDKPELEGVFNLAAPGPVTNSYFMATLRRLTHHRFGLPMPAWLLRLGALLIGTETELVLKSRWVLPAKLQKAGFTFQYEQVDSALQDIIGRTPPKKYRLI